MAEAWGVRETEKEGMSQDAGLRLQCPAGVTEEQVSVRSRPGEEDKTRQEVEVGMKRGSTLRCV